MRRETSSQIAPPHDARRSSRVRDESDRHIYRQGCEFQMIDGETAHTKAKLPKPTIAPPDAPPQDSPPTLRVAIESRIFFFFFFFFFFVGGDNIPVRDDRIT
jgi:hypothetical protein